MNSKIIRTQSTLGGVGHRFWWGALLILVIVFASYLGVLVRLAQIWVDNEDYSHGWLVLPFSGFLIYHFRHRWVPLVMESTSRWTVWLGVGLVVFALVIRAIGILARALPVEGGALPILMAGILCIAGGVGAIRCNAAAIAFLFFMLPIPGHFNHVVRSELQRVATQGSVFALQTIGVPTINQGNVLKLPHSEVGVVEACSGLRVLTSTAAMAFAMCVLLETRWLHRCLILACVIPIALFVNVARVVLTALGHEWYPAYTDWIHDVAGWLMVGMAVVSLVVVHRYFAALFPDEPTAAS